MNIEWVIPCRYVEVHDNLATMVGAGIDTLWVQGLPSLVNVTMAVRLVATAEEIASGVEHSARSIVRAPDGSVLSDVAQTFQAGGAAERPDFLAALTLPLMVQFQAATEGTYGFEHIVDGSSRTVPLHIIRASANQGT